MKRLFIAFAVLLLGLLAAVVAAVLLIDAESFRKPISDYASEALGREVTLGELEMSLFPMPAIRAHQLRIAGHRQGAEPFADVDELRLRVAVLPLLARRLVLRSVELDGPRIRIPFDAQGNPILPGPSSASGTESAAKSDAGSSPAEEQAATPDAAETSAGAEPLLAIDRIRIRDASLDAGAYRFSGGNLDGTFSLGGDADLSFELADTRYKQDDVELSGETRGTLELGKGWSIDLSDASLVSGDSFRKPAGERLIASGSLGRELSVAALRDATVKLGTNEIPLQLFFDRKRTEIQILPATIDLAALRPFLAPDMPKLWGHVVVEQMQVQLDPLSITGKAALQDAGTQLDPGRVSVTGPVVARGTSIALEPGSNAKLGDTPVAVSGSYDLSNGNARFEFGAQDADAGALIREFTGDSRLSGILAATGKFRMSGEGLDGLEGAGTLAIRPGEIEGFSLVHEILGPLAQLGVLFAHLKGKDLSRYESKQFDVLEARYELARGVLNLNEVLLQYQHATARLNGTVKLADGGLNLRGQVELSEELGDEITGTKSAKRKVIPIPSIVGTLDEPRVNIDQETLTRAVASFLVQDRVQDRISEELEGDLGTRLEEKLGPGAKDTIQGILGGILGTPPRSDKPAQSAPATQPAQQAPAEPPPEAPAPAPDTPGEPAASEAEPAGGTP